MIKPLKGSIIFCNGREILQPNRDSNKRYGKCISFLHYYYLFIKCAIALLFIESLLISSLLTMSPYNFIRQFKTFSPSALTLFPRHLHNLCPTNSLISLFFHTSRLPSPVSLHSTSPSSPSIHQSLFALFRLEM